MFRRCLAVILLLGWGRACGSVFSYECDSFPVDGSWEVLQNWCDPMEWVDQGHFYQQTDFCDGYDPPEGQQSSYTRSLDEFIGSQAFFMEWRVRTDGDRSEILYSAPAAFSVWSIGGVNYRFSIAADQVLFVRDNLLPIVWFDVTPALAHTYRLEMYGGAWYSLYVDGTVLDSGMPEGPYPSNSPAVNFRAKAQFVESTTVWDYVRWGDIPADGSGDFDSDGDRDLFDFYFVHECLTNRRPGINGGPDEDAGPGCRFADFDDDTDVDLRDVADFQNTFTGID